jgi:hypothetical protein
MPCPHHYVQVSRASPERNHRYLRTTAQTAGECCVRVLLVMAYACACVIWTLHWVHVHVMQ